MASPDDVHPPIAVSVDGYGDLAVTSTRDEEVLRSLTHVELPRLCRNVDGLTDSPWRLDLYPDEAFDLAIALLKHARALLA